MRFVNAPVEREVHGEAARDRSRLKALLLAVASIALALASIFGRHGVLDVQRYRAERDRLSAEIARLEEEQRRLEVDAATSGKDSAAHERIAREDLVLARPGEVVILLKPSAGTAQQAPRTTP